MRSEVEVPPRWSRCIRDDIGPPQTVQAMFQNAPLKIPREDRYAVERSMEFRTHQETSWARILRA